MGCPHLRLCLWESDRDVFTADIPRSEPGWCCIAQLVAGRSFWPPV